MIPSPQPSRLGFKLRSTSSIPGVVPKGEGVNGTAVMPITKVEVKSALIGGAIAAILFECAKILFLVYIRYFPGYDLIYGAFAVLPLSCLWIYISWIILLIGAVITFNLIEYKKKALTV